MTIVALVCRRVDRGLFFNAGPGKIDVKKEKKDSQTDY